MIVFLKTINLIKGCDIKHRLFKSFCQDYVSEDSILLFIRLLRVRTLRRCFELQKEVKSFL